MATRFITGAVVDAGCGSTQRLAGVRVVLGRTEGGSFTATDSTTTDETGHFRLPAPSDSESEYEVRVFRGRTPLGVGSGTASFLAADAPQRMVVSVSTTREERLDDATPTTKGFTGHTRGVIRHVRGHAIGGAGITVRGFDPITELETDPVSVAADGGYAIPFGGEGFSSTMIVRVYDDTTLIGQSHIHTADDPSDPEHDKIDIFVDSEDHRDKPEVTDSSEKLDGILELAGGAAATNAAKALYVAANAKHGTDRTLAYVLSKRMATDLPADDSVLFALLREGETPNATALGRLDDDDVRDALESAVDANILPVGIDIDAAIDDLTTAHRTRSLDSTKPKSIGKLLDEGAMSAGWDDTKRRKFLDTYAENPGPEVWDALVLLPEFDSDDVADLQRTVQLGTISVNHAPFLNALGTGVSVRDLAAYTDTQLGVLVDTSGWPDEVVGDDNAEKKENYVEVLQRNIELGFPNDVVRARIIAQAGDPDEVNFYQSAEGEDFDFRSTVVSALPELLPDPEEDATLRDTLRKRQRLFRLAPRFKRIDTMDVLAGEGIGSARDVHAMGRRAFVEKFSTLLGSADAAIAVADAAERQVTAAAALTARHLPSVSLGAVAQPGEAEERPFPEYDEWFGAVSYCACKDCRSALSPAAYLVDLLGWVNDQPTDTPLNSALDVLSARRSDLVDIELTCDNTQILVPYIDLVNEVLENAVAEATGGTAVAPTKTTGTNEERSVSPEYRNEHAYDALLAAVYPRNLPFHRAAEEARAHLQLFGLSRADLMLRLARSAVPSDTQLHQELLLTPPVAFDMLAGTWPLSTSGWTAWGYPFSSVGGQPWYELLAGSVPEILLRAQIGWDDLLDILAAPFCNPSGVFGVDGVDTCDVASMSISGEPDGDAFKDFHRYIRLNAAADLGRLDLDKALIAVTPTNTIDAATAGKIGLLAYISRRFGVAFVEVLSWVEPGNLDLHLDRPGAEPQIVPLYDRVFLDPTLPEATRALFALNMDRDELAVTELPMPPDINEAGPASAIMGVLGLTQRDWDALKTAIGAPVPFDLSNLSMVYRRVSFARAAGLSIPDALRLIALSGRSPFSSDPRDLLDFLTHELDRFKAARVSVDEIDYIRFHTASAGERVGASVDDLRNILGPLRETLRTVGGDAGPFQAVIGGLDSHFAAAITPANVADVVSDNAADLGQVVTIIGIDSDTGLPVTEALVLDGVEPVVGAVAWAQVLGILMDSVAAGNVVVRDAGTATVLTTLATSELSKGVYDFGDDVMEFGGGEANLASSGASTGDVIIIGSDLAPAIQSEKITLNGTAPVTGAASWSEIQYAVVGGVPAAQNLTIRGWNKGEVAAIVAAFVDATGTSSAVVSHLLHREFSALSDGDPETPPDTPISRLTDRAFIGQSLASPASDPWRDLIPETPPTSAIGFAFAAAELVLKCGTIAARWGVDGDELAAWFATVDSSGPPANPLGLLDLGTLPIAQVSPTSQAYDELIDAGVLFAQRDRLPGGIPSFAELIPLFGSGTSSAVATKIAGRTQWRASDVQYWLDQFEANPVKPEALRRAIGAIELTRLFGTPADIVDSWIQVDLAGWDDAAIEVAEAARAHAASASAWVAAARPVRDALRMKQRDALVAWLLPHFGFQVDEPDELFGKYLIDNQMSSCMVTSRLRQALNSVQLFVDRCFLGLEAGITLSARDAEEWKWRKSYSLWGAAWKVFFYAENWIEPDLRPDTSQQFDGLVAALQQGEITDLTVEDAFAKYLERLHRIANMRIVALYTEEADPVAETPQVDHVFANTRGQPDRYFHRRSVNGAWTPWERLHGVDDNHLVPIVRDGRLFLFWPTFVEQKPRTRDDQKQVGIILNWMERRGGVWSEKETNGREMLVVERFRQVKYDFYPDTSAGGLNIIVAERSHKKGRGKGLGRFRIIDATLDVRQRDELDDFDIWRQRLPKGTDPAANGFRQKDDARPLRLFSAELRQDGRIARRTLVESTVLRDTPHVMRVVRPSPLQAYLSRGLCAIQDGHRTFLVAPETPDERIGRSLREAPGANLENVGSKIRVEVLRTADDPVKSETVGSVKELLIGRSETERNFVQAVAEEFQDQESADRSQELAQPAKYQFIGFYHPFILDFRKVVNRYGLFGGLLDPDEDGPAGYLARQVVAETFDFKATYNPTRVVKKKYPKETIAFGTSDPYSLYNWELFFHAPFLVANQLMASGKFADARRWLHTIFDPQNRTTKFVDGNDGYNSASRYWKVKPFLHGASTVLSQWEAFITDPDGEAAADFAAEVAQWRQDPFDPHLVARMRPGTYQRAVIMRYLDNLIAWGDDLFRRNTIESINEATQLYILAAHILGDRPVELSEQQPPNAQSFSSLQGGEVAAIDEIQVQAENYAGSVSQYLAADGPPIPIRRGASYFCVPPNEKLLGYWDIVADRLFKVRNCQNIEGQVQQLALFEPIADPGLLVRAAAAGVDLGNVLSGSTASPHYRFTTQIEKARNLARSVQALGSALLSALEKRDAEALALLRQRHEGALLRRTRRVRERQVEAAEADLEAARASRATTRQRRNYFQRLVDNGLLGSEKNYERLITTAESLSAIQQTLTGSAAVIAAIPQIHLTAKVGTPEVTTEQGGEQTAKATEASAVTVGIIAQQLASFGAQLASRQAANKRREQDWQQQVDAADRELEANEKQILAARIRLQIARQELRNHDLQVEQSKEVLDFMRSKFTNRQLYRWMVGQLSALHYRTYQLAFDEAVKAQKCFEREQADTTVFIRYGQWDGLRKGLLAGEQLQADLEALDAAFMEADEREYELTKHVNLSQLDPVALQALKTDGDCWFEIPEEWYDRDCPGDYFRRLQAVAVSIAAVGDNPTTINTELTLVKHVRRDADDIPAMGNPPDPLPEGDWIEDNTSITTSVATNDHGLFNADLRDPRYLPFERRGAISRWRMRLRASVWKQLDWDSITEVTLHVRYTARYGGDDFRDDVNAFQVDALAASEGAFTDDTFGTALTTGLPVLISAARNRRDTWVKAQDEDQDGVSFNLSGAVPVIEYDDDPDTPPSPQESLEIKTVVAIPVGDRAVTSTIDYCKIDTVEAAAIGPIGGVRLFAVAAPAADPLSVEFRAGGSGGTLVKPGQLEDVLLILLMETAT